MPKKKVADELSFWDERLVKKLAKRRGGFTNITGDQAPSPIAEAIIRKAFPGYALRKIRKDTGTTKLQELGT